MGRCFLRATVDVAFSFFPFRHGIDCEGVERALAFSDPIEKWKRENGHRDSFENDWHYWRLVKGWKGIGRKGACACIRGGICIGVFLLNLSSSSRLYLLGALFGF